ncbi:hypothetical protein HGRIS_013176 [Hohenbuehelia grisea]|uniref:Uncharacterized protein n=1 Tax=Hohenbuehelia grisea TaxID=104357 RepID=A0ABR3IUV6_9AGAR
MARQQDNGGGCSRRLGAIPACFNVDGERSVDCINDSAVNIGIQGPVNLASPILRNLLADEPSTAEQEPEAPPSKAKKDEDPGDDNEFNGLDWNS